MTKRYNQRAYSVHPSSIIMVLLLIGITALFSALSFAYIYTRIDRGMPGIRIPWLFVFNTLILISSSYCIQQCRRYFERQNEKQILRWGFLTIAATLLFLVLQGIGWNNLLSEQVLPGSSGGHGYLYAISILHFFHVVAGIPFLLRILIPLYTAQKEGNGVLFFVQDDLKTRLKHTAWYWHFIDIMWIYLMILFLISSLI